MKTKTRKRVYLVHLEEARVDFSPVRDAGGDGVQLGGVFVERAVLNLVDARDGHEVEVRGGQGRVQDGGDGDVRLICAIRKKK